MSWRQDVSNRMCTSKHFTQHVPLPACLLQQAQLKEYGTAIQMVKAKNVEETKRAKAHAASAAAVHRDLVSQSQHDRIVAAYTHHSPIGDGMFEGHEGHMRAA